MKEGVQKQIINSYYGDDGLQYSLGRFPMAGCDFSTYTYTFVFFFFCFFLLLLFCCFVVLFFAFCFFALFFILFVFVFVFLFFLFCFFLFLFFSFWLFIFHSDIAIHQMILIWKHLMFQLIWQPKFPLDGWPKTLLLNQLSGLVVWVFLFFLLFSFSLFSVFHGLFDFSSFLFFLFSFSSFFCFDLDSFGIAMVCSCVDENKWRFRWRISHWYSRSLFNLFFFIN